MLEAETQRGLHSLALEIQSRLQRIVEMARIIERDSADLPLDSEPGRFRVCAEVIWEAAEAAIEEAEKVETTCARAFASPAGEAADA